MHQTVIKHLEDRFESLIDLVNTVSDASLHDNLEVNNSKNLTTHMWCVIGARESYSVALKAGVWSGFSCSLTEFNVDSIKEALNTSAAAFRKAIASIDDWSEEREELLANLLEHEVMHEGQIIRLFYGLGRKLPKSVKWD